MAPLGARVSQRSTTMTTTTSTSSPLPLRIKRSADEMLAEALASHYQSDAGIPSSSATSITSQPQDPQACPQSPTKRQKTAQPTKLQPETHTPNTPTAPNTALPEIPIPKTPSPLTKLTQKLAKTHMLHEAGIAAHSFSLRHLPGEQGNHYATVCVEACYEILDSGDSEAIVVRARMMLATNGMGEDYKDRV
jgi:hypothetical protein